MKNTNIKELSIQVNLNGLSFCILNRSTYTIELLKSVDFIEKLTPFNALNKLKTELSTDSAFAQKFNSVTVIHQNELATAVPKEIYNENYKVDYLKFNAKILKTDFITHDEIVINESINVYIPYVNINNYIYDTFGEFIYKHSSTVLIDTLLQDQKDSVESFMHVNVNRASLEIVVTNKGKLELFNVFEYSSKEDFIYYILFVFEQLNLDAETVAVKLSGNINKEDDLYLIIYKYVRYVDIVETNYSYKFSSSISSDKQERLHHHYILLNSF